VDGQSGVNQEHYLKAVKAKHEANLHEERRGAEVRLSEVSAELKLLGDEQSPKPDAVVPNPVEPRSLEEQLRQADRGHLVSALLYYLAAGLFILADIELSLRILADAYEMKGVGAWLLAVPLGFSAFLFKPVVELLVRQFHKHDPSPWNRCLYYLYQFLNVGLALVALVTLGIFRDLASDVQQALLQNRNLDLDQLAALISNLQSHWSGSAAFILITVLFAVGAATSLAEAAIRQQKWSSEVRWLKLQVKKQQSLLFEAQKKTEQEQARLNDEKAHRLALVTEQARLSARLAQDDKLLAEQRSSGESEEYLRGYEVGKPKPAPAAPPPKPEPLGPLDDLKAKIHANSFLLLLAGSLLVAGCEGQSYTCQASQYRAVVFIDRSQSVQADSAASVGFSERAAAILSNLKCHGDTIYLVGIHRDTGASFDILQITNDLTPMNLSELSKARQRLAQLQHEEDLQQFLIAGLELYNNFARRDLSEELPQYQLELHTNLTGALRSLSDILSRTSVPQEEAFFFSDMFESNATASGRDFDIHPPPSVEYSRAWAIEDIARLKPGLDLRALQRVTVHVCPGSLVARDPEGLVRTYWLTLFEGLGMHGFYDQQAF
jgi:hypothetical protein